MLSSLLVDKSEFCIKILTIEKVSPLLSPLSLVKLSIYFIINRKETSNYSLKININQNF